MTLTELFQIFRLETTLAVTAMESGHVEECVVHMRKASAAALELQRVSVWCGAPRRGP